MHLLLLKEGEKIGEQSSYVIGQDDSNLLKAVARDLGVQWRDPRSLPIDRDNPKNVVRLLRAE